MKIQASDFKTYKFEGQQNLSVGDNYGFSAVAILTHILRLPSTKVLAKKSWILTDDYQAEFEYKGYVFVICTPMDSVDIFPFDKSVPNEITIELYAHIKSFKSVSLFNRFLTTVNCIFVPFNYEP